MDGIDKTIEYMDRLEEELIFTNLVGFDMLYGHRNDALGFDKVLKETDIRLSKIMTKMRDNELLG